MRIALLTVSAMLVFSSASHAALTASQQQKLVDVGNGWKATEAALKRAAGNRPLRRALKQLDREVVLGTRRFRAQRERYGLWKYTVVEKLVLGSRGLHVNRKFVEEQPGDATYLGMIVDEAGNHRVHAGWKPLSFTPRLSSAWKHLTADAIDHTVEAVVREVTE